MGSSLSSSSGNSSGRRYSSHPYYQYPNSNYYYSPSHGTSSAYPPPPHAPQHPPPPPPHYGQHPGPPSHIPPNYNYNYPGPAWSGSGSYNYGNPSTYRQNYPSYYGDQSSGGWWAQQTNFSVPTPPYVEHQSTVKVKNDVNVHKGSVKLEMDEDYSDRYLVSFDFDAEFDGRITICYMAKEDKENPNIIPERPELFEPLTIPFQKGLGQKFQQPSGTGVDLGFFDFDELAKPSMDGTVFPLVILAEVVSTQNQSDTESRSGDANSHFQFTMGVLEKKNGGEFQVKVLKQILWIDGVRYELQDLYGIANKSEEGFTDDEPGKECVICMTELKNTAVLPCRHLCMCEDCAKELRLQTNKCPICRTPITELIEININ